MRLVILLALLLAGCASTYPCHLENPMGENVTKGIPCQCTKTTITCDMTD